MCYTLDLGSNYALFFIMAISTALIGWFFMWERKKRKEEFSTLLGYFEKAKEEEYINN